MNTDIIYTITIEHKRLMSMIILYNSYKKKNVLSKLVSERVSNKADIMVSKMVSKMVNRKLLTGTPPLKFTRLPATIFSTPSILRSAS